MTQSQPQLQLEPQSQLQPQPQLQLRMLLSPRGRHAFPVPSMPADYRLRQFLPADEPTYLATMVAAGFGHWNPEQLARTLPTILPDGFFVIEHLPSGAVVASAMAQANSIDDLPSSAELGWVACHPDHRARGLGLTVCAVATARLVAEHYQNIYLKTDDFRLPALRIYLALGYEPWLYAPDMLPRWQALQLALAPHRLALPT